MACQYSRLRSHIPLLLLCRINAKERKRPVQRIHGMVGYYLICPPWFAFFARLGGGENNMCHTNKYYLQQGAMAEWLKRQTRIRLLKEQRDHLICSGLRAQVRILLASFFGFPALFVAPAVSPCLVLQSRDFQHCWMFFGVAKESIEATGMNRAFVRVVGRIRYFHGTPHSSP